MPWTKLDDKFYANAKQMTLSDSAFRLYVLALNWSVAHMTDGRVPPQVPHMLRGGAGDVAECTGELVEAGFFVAGDSGWLINDFLEYQPSREQVEKRKASDAARKRRVRTESARSPHGHNGGVSARNPQYPEPDPEPEPEPEPEPFNNSLRELDELWESIVAVHGQPANQTERGKFNKARKLLSEADVTGDEYPSLVQAYTSKHDSLQPAVMTVATRVGELRHFRDKGPIRAVTADDRKWERLHQEHGNEALGAGQ